MKRTLSEELERIHSITYGKEVINEEGFLDKLLQKVGLKKSDDPKKADLVSDDVNEFFKTLEDASNSGGLSQQKKGSMSFQKGVESMQIGLILLGYELPRYGVDGLFGPETAAAVTKFNSENKILSEAIEFVSGKGLIGKPGQGTHNASDWQSKNAWDVKTEPNATVKSLTSGTVSKVTKSGSGLKNVGNKKIYGDQVTVTSSNGPDVFYTHITSSVSQGQNISVGDVIGQVMEIPGMPPHVHVGLSSGNLSDLASNLPQATGGSESEKMTQASPEMLNKLIGLLKDKGVTSEDLRSHIDTVNTEGLADQNFYAKLLENLKAPVSEENLKFMYAWRQAEGKGGKFNPFNTTLDMPGATNMNSVGVKNYQTLQDGMIATIKTLKNGRYNCIVDGLKNDIGASNIAKCESLKTWGTGELVAKVVSSYNSGASPNIKNLA